MQKDLFDIIIKKIIDNFIHNYPEVFKDIRMDDNDIIFKKIYDIIDNDINIMVNGGNFNAPFSITYLDPVDKLFHLVTINNNYNQTTNSYSLVITIKKKKSETITIWEK
jgi:hypothetical protein